MSGITGTGVNSLYDNLNGARQQEGPPNEFLYGALPPLSRNEETGSENFYGALPPLTLRPSPPLTRSGSHEHPVVGELRFVPGQTGPKACHEDKPAPPVPRRPSKSEEPVSPLHRHSTSDSSGPPSPDTSDRRRNAEYLQPRGYEGELGNYMSVGEAVSAVAALTAEGSSREYTEVDDVDSLSNLVKYTHMRNPKNGPVIDDPQSRPFSSFGSQSDAGSDPYAALESMLQTRGAVVTFKPLLGRSRIVSLNAPNDYNAGEYNHPKLCASFLHVKTCGISILVSKGVFGTHMSLVNDAADSRTKNTFGNLRVLTTKDKKDTCVVATNKTGQLIMATTQLTF